MVAIREKAKKFQKFVKELKGKYPQALPDPRLPLVDRFIFYLLFYSNPITYARKAYRSLTDEKLFASWSEVRVSTVREICQVLEDAKVKPAEFLAPRLKEFLQKVFEEVDDTSLEPLQEVISTAENARRRKELTDAAKKFVQELAAHEIMLPSPLGGPIFPPWGSTYLLTGLGLDTQVPWDPHSEAVLEAQKAFPPKSTLTQKKRVMKALLDGLDTMTPLDVHHLLVEHAKRDLKRK